MTTAASKRGITDQARQAEAAGWRQEADWLFRLAFARGERGADVDAAIDRMTAAAVHAHGSIEVTQVRGLTERREDRVLSEAGAIRDLLEHDLESRLTLMDLTEMMDIASPLFPLKGLRLLQHIDAEEEEPLSLNLEAIFDQGPRGRHETFYTQQLLVKPGGAPEIWSGNVFIEKAARGHGVGARQMLRLAQFARLHGIASWDDHISDDGIFTWPRLGAIPQQETIDAVIGRLEELQRVGAVSAIRIPGRDLAELARVTIPGALSVEALKGWCRGSCRMSRLSTESIAPPYPVGLWALHGTTVYADFPTEPILEKLLNDYFPKRIVRDAHRMPGMDPAAHALAGGMRLAFAGEYESAYRREAAVGSALQKVGLASPVPLTPPASFGIPAIAARMVVGGCAVLR